MLAEQQIKYRQIPLLTRSTSSSTQSSDSSDESHPTTASQISTTQADPGDAGLLYTLQTLTKNTFNVTSTQYDAPNKNLKSVSHKGINDSYASTEGNPFESTPSSVPVGAKWALGALIKNVEAIMGPNAKVIKDMFGLIRPQKYRLVQGLVERLLSKHAPVNDRHNTFEAVMKILGTMGPEQDDLIYALSQPILHEFHTEIQKPFVNYAGNSFRTADGSNNSLLFPDVGKAGTNYVRTVTSKTPVNNDLPDPSVVFNRLFKRSEFTPHKGGINMLLFYFATIIIHDLFYTDPKDPQKNLTSSYADQAYLYGFNRTDQESVRQMKNGLLKPDQWFDRRLMIHPPGVNAMIVLFSRNHNYIAKQLLERNEGGRFSYGPGKSLANEKEQDEELFQTARLINNACTFKIIEQEYARAILGIRQDAYFTLDLLGETPPPLYGNAVSIEFNATYRWHQALGEEDAAWTDEVIKALGKPMCEAYMEARKETEEPANINGKQGTDQSIFEYILPAFNDHFVQASTEELNLGLPIAGIHREAKTGQFSDFDLAKCLRKGYNQIAGEVGNGLKVPASMEHIEIQAILQCRKLRCCSFNDLRRHFNLAPLTTFEDFSEIPEVQKALEELYGTPDRVELYAGAMIERPKVTGLRLPYTIGRAILADAINLVRNDRIILQELIPSNMTNWGYEYSMSKELGRILPRMINNLLPNSNANGQPVFSEEEMGTLFFAPGHPPPPPPAPFNPL